MTKYAVTTGKPLLRVRNVENRNQRRLAKRIARLSYGRHVTHVTRESGRYELFNREDITTYSVKRDAERAAKRVGGRFVTL